MNLYTKKVEYIFSPEAREVMDEYIKGNYGSRESARIIGCSHQQLINMVSRYTRILYQEGKLKI